MRLRSAVAGRDGICFARLDGGGGVLSFEKVDAGAASASVSRWVHTLNTESGLLRKLLAIEGGRAARPLTVSVVEIPFNIESGRGECRDEDDR